jgi:hypothetical protein
MQLLLPLMLLWMMMMLVILLHCLSHNILVGHDVRHAAVAAAVAVLRLALVAVAVPYWISLDYNG